VEPFRLYARLIGAQLRAQMQYKVSFLLAFVGSFLANIIEFFVILVVFSRIPELAGWSLPEVALLYGISGVTFAVAEMIGAALDTFQTHIVQGTFDRILARPRGALFQVISEDFALRRIGRVLQGLVVLVYALASVSIEWTPDRQLVFVSALISATVIYFSIFVLGGAFCFWTVQGKEATHVFTYGGDATVSVPLDIYRPSIRRFFTFVVPLAFVNYQPVLYLLGRPDPLGLPDAMRLMAPLAAAGMAVLAWLGWQQGVRHYQSSGS